MRVGSTLQEINISHLGKRKIIFKMDFSGDALVPRRVIQCCFVVLRLTLPFKFVQRVSLPLRNERFEKMMPLSQNWGQNETAIHNKNPHLSLWIQVPSLARYWKAPTLYIPTRAWNQAAGPWIHIGGINQAFWRLHPRVLLFEIPFVAHLSQEQNRRILSIILVV